MTTSSLPAPRSAWRYIIAGTLLLLFLGQDCCFIVHEREAVIVARWGNPVRELTRAGLYLKLPAPIDQLHRIDRRKHHLSTSEAASFTQDKRNIVLTTFVVWRVENPLRYLQSIGDTADAENSLTGMVLSAKHQTVSQFPLTAFVSLQSDEIQVEHIEQLITKQVNDAALERLGIGVDQVGIERIAFPAENMAAVMERMRAERLAEANRIRAEGAKRAQAIRDETHVQTQEILRQGREEAARITAEAESRAADLLAKSHQKSPQFYTFWSSLQAAKRILKDKSTLILSTDQLVFHGLAQPVDSAKGLLVDQPNKEILPVAPTESAGAGAYDQR